MKEVSIDRAEALDPYSDPKRYEAGIAASEREYAALDRALADAREQDERNQEIS